MSEGTSLGAESAALESRRLGGEARRERADLALEALFGPLPRVEGGFRCILADPPWAFRTYQSAGAIPQRAAVQHYRVVPMPMLKALSVAEVAASDCVLVMWVLDAMVPQALALGQAWGFSYRTLGPVWVKDRRGKRPNLSMGYWFRKQAEITFLFGRGSPPRLSKGVEQLIYCPRGAHSAKPHQQYDRLEALVGGPYLELFARSNRENWHSWGNEVGKHDGSLASNSSMQPMPDPQPAHVRILRAQPGVPTRADEQMPDLFASHIDGVEAQKLRTDRD